MYGQKLYMYYYIFIVLFYLLPCIYGYDHTCYISSEPLITAHDNQGVCEWHNGKSGRCSTCSNLTPSKINISHYDPLFSNTITAGGCGAPPESCNDYLLTFLCGLYCSPNIVQEIESTNQNTVCQYFADKMWEQCKDWQVREVNPANASAPGQCVSLRTKYSNAKLFYGSFNFTVWAPQVEKYVWDGIQNCFNTAATLPRPSTSIYSILILSILFALLRR